jgi:hypothetical protein
MVEGANPRGRAAPRYSRFLRGQRMLFQMPDVTTGADWKTASAPNGSRDCARLRDRKLAFPKAATLETRGRRLWVVRAHRQSHAETDFDVEHEMPRGATIPEGGRNLFRQLIQACVQRSAIDSRKISACRFENGSESISTFPPHPAFPCRLSAKAPRKIGGLLRGK